MSTEQDVAHLQQDMSEIKTDIAVIKADLNNHITALTEDVHELRSDVREVRNKIERLFGVVMSNSSERGKNGNGWKSALPIVIAAMGWLFGLVTLILNHLLRL